MASGVVLVVEDHADTRHMVEEYLRFHEIEVVSAENGLLALAALQEHRPCVVLLDLSMPVMDGWRFREQQQRLSDGELAGTPVVILSAVSDVKHHMATLGAVDVIQKPIDFDRMVEIVKAFSPVPHVRTNPADQSGA